MKCIRRHSRSGQALGQIECPSNHRQFTLPVGAHPRVAAREHNVIEIQRCLSDRSNVDDASRTRRFEQWKQPLRQKIGSEVVHRKTKFISVLTELSFRGVLAETDSRIVHEHIKPSDIGDDLPSQLPHFSKRRKIGAVKLNPVVPGRFFDLAHQSWTAVRIASMQYQACALPRQSLTQLLAQPTAPASNYYGFF